MKTVQILEDKSIKRVSNEEAEEMVSSSIAVYVAKKLWKEQIRDAKEKKDKNNK